MAPELFCHHFRRNLENELSADTEQCPPRVLALASIMLTSSRRLRRSPSSCSQGKDFFDAAASRKPPGWSALSASAGRKEHWVVKARLHGYTQDNREAMYRGSAARAAAGGALRTSPDNGEDETLWCTPRGQVADLQREPSSPSLRKSHAACARNAVSDRRKTAPAVVEILKLPRRAGVPITDSPPSSSRRYPKKNAATYAVETEPACTPCLRPDDEPLMSRPVGANRRALLYISHQSAMRNSAMNPAGRVNPSEPQSAVYTCDVRGIANPA